MPKILFAIRVSLLLPLVAIALVTIDCSVGGEPPPARSGPPAQAPAVPVTTAIAVQKSMPLTVSVVGTAEAYSTVAVHAQITGELTSVHFKDGDNVTKGQVLAELDRRPLEAALQQAEAALARDLAQAANARSQSTRYRDLAERGIATREQVDQNATNAAALDATVAADRAAVDNAKVQLQYATITSPISGRTGKLMVHVGNLVRANDTMPLVVINQVSPLYVSFGLPEADLTEFKRYMSKEALRVDARAPNDPAAPSIGRVSFVDNAVDQTTGTIAVRGEFPNGDGRLWPGQFVAVVVTLSNDRDVTVVPSTAVQTSQQGYYAFIVKPDKTVEMRTVQVARVAGPETVVRSGVAPGETVVTEGHLRLVSGSRISIRESQLPGGGP